MLAEINGWNSKGEPLSSYTQLKDDGSTTCGCWIYCGVYAGGVNQAARRVPGGQQNWIANEWGWAWPANRRVLYNRASADPDGRPWSERKALVWWDAENNRWTGHDVPDFIADRPPDYTPPDGATGVAAITGTDPFIMQNDGKAWLFAPAGLVDGPMPTHYEPQESPFANPLYGQQHNPVRQIISRPQSLYEPSGNEPGSGVFPYVATTYPADRASHGGRHVTVRCPTWRNCSRRSSAKCRRNWPPSAAWSTPAGPRSSPRAARSRPASWSPNGCARCGWPARWCTRSGCPSTGARTG